MAAWSHHASLGSPWKGALWNKSNSVGNVCQWYQSEERIREESSVLAYYLENPDSSMKVVETFNLVGSGLYYGLEYSVIRYVCRSLKRVKEANLRM
jgi:hypothetical protein